LSIDGQIMVLDGQKFILSNDYSQWFRYGEVPTVNFKDGQVNFEGCAVNFNRYAQSGSKFKIT